MSDPHYVIEYQCDLCDEMDNDLPSGNEFCKNCGLGNMRRVDRLSMIEINKLRMLASEPKISICNNVRICELCLGGRGGECHVPGCVFWMVSAPDIPIRRKIIDLGGNVITEEAMALPATEGQT